MRGALFSSPACTAEQLRRVGREVVRDSGAVDAVTLQFSVRHQRAAEGNSTDVGAQVCHDLGEVGCRVGGKMGVLHHVLGYAGQHGSQAHQAVEGSYQLWQVGDLDLFSDCQA